MMAMTKENMEGMMTYAGENLPRKFLWTVLSVKYWQTVRDKKRKRDALMASVLLLPTLGGLAAWMMSQPYRHDVNFLGGILGLILLTVGSIFVVFVLPTLVFFAWFDMNKMAQSFAKD